jgi:hypothetical protein
VAVGGAVTAPVATEAALTATDLAIGGGSLAGTAPIVGAGAGAAASSTLGSNTYNEVLNQLTQYPRTLPSEFSTALGDMAGTGAGGGLTSGGIGGAAGAAAAASSVAAANAASSGGSSILNGAGGNMNLSDFSSALNIASSVNSLTGGGVSSLLGGPGSISGSEAQQMADPFAPYRANLGQMYSGALQPGTGIDITKMPGYEQYTTGVLNPAMEASKRSAAASGLMYSGRESAALQDIGQRGYYGFMTDYLNRLAQGSGATQNPAQAGGLGISQNMANQQAFSQGLGGLGQGIAGLYGSGNTQQYSPQQFQQQQASYYGSGNAGFD